MPVISLNITQPAGDDRPVPDVGFQLRKHPDRVYRPGNKPGPVSVYWSLAYDGGAEVVFEYDPAAFGSEVAADGYVGPEPYLCGSVAVGHFGRAFASCMHGEDDGRLYDWQAMASAVRRGVNTDILCGGGWEAEDIQDCGLELTARGKTAKQAISELYTLLLAASGDADLTDEGRVKYVREGGAFLAAHPHRDALVAAVVRRRKDQAALCALLEAAGGDAAEVAVPEGEEEGEAAAAPADGEKHGEGGSLAERRRAWLIERLSTLPQGARVLEVGCGTGWVPQKLAQTRPDIAYLAVDPSVRSVALARKFNRKHPQVRVFQGALDWERLGLPADLPELAQPFDAIVASEVLEHINYGAALGWFSHAALLVKPGGMVLETVPNGEYNTLWGIPHGKPRHPDHRWELSWRGALEAAQTEDPRTCTVLTGISSEDHPEHPFLGPPSVGMELRDDRATVEASAARCAVRPCMWGADPPKLADRAVILGRGQRMMAFEAISSYQHINCCYLPPTMAPAGTSARDGYLEHPEDAFAYYRERLGADATVAVQEKHMGSRAIVFVSPYQAEDRHVQGIWTRYGRRFFTDPNVEGEILDDLSAAMWKAGVWDSLGPDAQGALFDAELMPWGAKAAGLIARQYTATTRAGEVACGMMASARQKYNERALYEVTPDRPFDARLDESTPKKRVEALESMARMLERFAGMPGEAPWINLFGALGVWRGKNQHDAVFTRWTADLRDTMPMFDKIAAASNGKRARSTVTRFVRLSDAEAEAAATAEWMRYTSADVGGEGFVVKPTAPWPTLPDGSPAQPAVKVRGQEYLRIVYGPHYTEHLDKLRQRKLGSKRFMGLWQQARGLDMIEALEKHDTDAMSRAIFWLLASTYRPSDPRL